MTIDLNNILKSAKEWQTLVGSAVPIIFTIFMFRYQNKKDFKQGLGSIERVLAQSMNDLIELSDELNLFVNRLDELINSIRNSGENEYFVGWSNFPIHEIESSDILMRTKTNSLYLANKLMRNYILLKSINSQVTGLRDEFISLMNRNHDIIISYKNPKENIGVSPIIQKELILSSLLSMREVLGNNIIRKNIPTAIKSLLNTKIYLVKYMKYTHYTKLFYEGPFNCFIKKEDGIAKLENRKKIKNEFDNNWIKIKNRLNDNMTNNIKS